jgi:hypothetical protein
MIYYMGFDGESAIVLCLISKLFLGFDKLWVRESDQNYNFGPPIKS